MLDQVKSGTAARIATSRTAPGQPGAGEVVRGRQIAAASGTNGTDDDQMPSSERHPDGKERRPEHGAAAIAVDPASRQQPPGDASSPLAAPAPVPDEVGRGAIASLLKDVSALRRADPAPSGTVAAAPQARRDMGGGAVAYNRAADAYASQGSLGERDTVLRPGVVYSARF